MFKLALTALATLSIFLCSTASATECDPDSVHGSYVALRSDFSGSGNGTLDQLVLGKGGTAYFYRSTSFDLMLTTGSFIPEIGSWKCNDDGTLVVTTIAVNYAPVSGPDLAKYQNRRRTQKLSVVDSNTLQSIIRVSRYFALTDDPLGSNWIGSPVSDTTQFVFKRVKPFKSDLP